MSHPADDSWPYGESARGWKPYYRVFGGGLAMALEILRLWVSHGQIIRVSPRDDLVIVYLSSWPPLRERSLVVMRLMKIFLRG